MQMIRNQHKYIKRVLLVSKNTSLLHERPDLYLTYFDNLAALTSINHLEDLDLIIIDYQIIDNQQQLFYLVKQLTLLHTAVIYILLPIKDDDYKFFIHKLIDNKFYNIIDYNDFEIDDIFRDKTLEEVEYLKICTLPCTGKMITDLFIKLRNYTRWNHYKSYYQNKNIMHVALAFLIIIVLTLIILLICYYCIIQTDFVKSVIMGRQQ